METLAFSDDFNSLGSFFGHVLFGTVAGGLFALLYWQRPMQQLGWSRVAESTPPAMKFALGLFLVPTLLFAVWAYCSYLTPFFAARVSSAAITFEYRFPDRAVTVPLRDIERVVKGRGSEQSAWVPLVVYTKDGRRFESAPIKADRFEGLKSRMRPGP
jgi:hypothetical protein